MRKIQFVKDYTTRLSGDIWDGCEAQLASELVSMKVAKYIDEGERASFKLVAPDGAQNEFIITDEHLENDPSLVDQGVKVGDKVIVHATCIPCTSSTESNDVVDSDVVDSEDADADIKADEKPIEESEVNAPIESANNSKELTDEVSKDAQADEKQPEVKQPEAPKPANTAKPSTKKQSKPTSK